MSLISMLFSYLILLAAIANVIWGSLGFLEYFSGVAPLRSLQNPTFPSGTQFIHWLLIFSSGSLFLLGYLQRWKQTPIIMVVLYSMMATMCAIQTFDMMTNPGRYLSFVFECLAYIGISIYLFRSKRMRKHFNR